MEETQTTTPPDEPKKPRIGLIVGGSVVAVLALIFGARTISYNQGHATTDDAYVTTDVVPVNVQISGQVTELKVSDNQQVTANQSLATLDSRTYQADYDQAVANLKAAEADVRSAEANQLLVKQTVGAQVSQARNGLMTTESDAAVSMAGIAKEKANLLSAHSELLASRSNAEVAQDAVRLSQLSVQRFKLELKSAQAKVASAVANLESSRAELKSAQSKSEQAERDAKRARNLANSGAISEADSETAETQAATQRASLDEANSRVRSAQSSLDDSRASAMAAQEAETQAEITVKQTRLQAESVTQNIGTKQALIAQTEASITAAEAQYRSSIAKKNEAKGHVAETVASTNKNEVSGATLETARAKVEQAKATLEAAQLALDRTKIVSPIAGEVSKRVAQIGQQLAAGETILVLIPSRDPWIIANFKETQVSRMKIGQEAEIEIDAFPGHPLKGHVDSISMGTGATFALLPPDNATGNFTKVVQRVPVKIILDQGQEGVKKLRSGLSCSVAISL